MLKQIDHIGIAVRDLDQSLKRYERLFQARANHIEVIEKSCLRVAFIPIGESSLELLEPLIPGKGQLGELLEKYGEGAVHIAYRVDRLGEILTEMKKTGVRLRDEKPRVGTRGALVAFISPEETNNVLTELVERKG